MILIDANILIYATDSNSERHTVASGWLDAQLSGATAVGLPWPSLLAFLRLATNPRIFPHPLRMSAAWKQVAAWLEADPVWIPQPTGHHAETLRGLLAEPGIHGNLVPDAHLAALAVEHGLTLCSTDGDFARFKNLRWRNPL